MLVLAIRALILFSLVFIATRIMGKREIGQLQPFEFVIAIMMADLASVPISDTGIPLLHGVVPILVLTGMHILFSLISLKSKTLRDFISGRPVVIIRRGQILEREMRRLRYNLSDLMEELRSNGILSVSDVEYAVLETSGRLSVMTKSQKRPLQGADLGMFIPADPMAYTLIVDGVLNKQNLYESGHSESWLLDKIKSYGFSTWSEVFLASVDDNQEFFIQGYEVHK